MSMVLKIDEIVEEYPQSYVLLEHCKFGEDSTLTHASIVCSSGDERTVYDALRDHPNSLIIFTGPPSDETEGAWLDRGQVWEDVVSQ